MCGLGFNGGRFVIFFSVLLIEQYIAVAFATLCIAVSRDFAIASLIGNLAYTWQTYACGFFIQTQNLPVYLRWTKWTAFVVCEIVVTTFPLLNFSIVLCLWCTLHK
jgi:hypothetical protein